MIGDPDLIRYAFAVSRLLNCLEYVECTGTPARQTEYGQAVAEVMKETAKWLTPEVPPDVPNPFEVRS
jgi:hypothetical protein